MQYVFLEPHSNTQQSRIMRHPAGKCFLQFSWLLLASWILVVSVKAKDHSNIRNDLEIVSAKVVDLTAETDLLATEEFLHLYRNPRVEAVLGALVDSSLDEQKKTIALLSIQNLPLEDYLVFLQQIVQLRQANRVSAAIFEKALFPGYMWSTKLEEHHTRSNVVALLERLKSSRLLTASQRSRVANILNGQAKKHIQEFRHSEHLLRPSEIRPNVNLDH